MTNKEICKSLNIKRICRHMKHLIISCLLFLATVNFSFAVVNAPDFSLHGEEDKVYRLEDFKGKPLILFFFSFSCGHCEKAMPVIKDLYKNSNGRYNILGVVYGTPKENLKNKKMENWADFPVVIGTESVRKDYKVSGTPYIWVIGPDGTLKERFIGGRGAEMLTPPRSPSQDQLPSYPLFGKEGKPQGRGVGELRVGLFELSSDPKGYEGKDIEVGGLLIQTSPSYFPKPVFMITNGTDKVRVSAWLPMEVAPSPKGLKKQRKKVMSDFLDKYVIISGKVVLEDGRPVIEVKDGKLLE